MVSVPAVFELDGAGLLQPVDHGVCVLLHGCGEYGDVVPLTGLLEEHVAVGALGDVIERGYVCLREADLD